MRPRQTSSLRNKQHHSLRAWGLAGMALLSWIAVFSYLQFGQMPPSPLPQPPPEKNAVRWDQLSTEWSGATRYVDWATAFESQTDFFVVERSFDNTHFAPIGQVEGVGESTEVWAYQFLDDEPFPDPLPAFFYRVRQVARNGKDAYSPVLTLLPPPAPPARTLGARE